MKPTEYVKILDNRIGECRREQGLTQQQLADGLGWSLRKLTSYERGERVPPLTEAVQLATALEVTIDDLWCFGIAFFPQDHT